MYRSASIPATFLLMALAGSLVGCSDPKAASEKNFRAALEPVVRDVFCLPIDVMSFEIEGQGEKTMFPVVTSPERTMFGAGADGKSVAMLDAAAGEGLVTRTTFEKPARWEGSDRPFVRQPLIAYAPTEKGAPFLRAIERKATKGSVTVPAFCTARGEVVHVVRWSEPVDFGGRRTSSVTYRYRAVDPLPVIPQAERARMAEPREATKSLVLASDGWRPA
jgi:hypothetical protein